MPRGYLKKLFPKSDKKYFDLVDSVVYCGEMYNIVEDSEIDKCERFFTMPVPMFTPMGNGIMDKRIKEFKEQNDDQSNI